MLLQRLLKEELTRRQSRNRRYSLRAFARDLAVHHSTLSRVLRGRQRVMTETLTALAARLRLAPDVVQESAMSEADGAVLAAIGRDRFRADCRWIATVTGLPLDEVNTAIHRLLRKRMVEMPSADAWVVIDHSAGTTSTPTESTS